MLFCQHSLILHVQINIFIEIEEENSDNLKITERGKREREGEGDLGEKKWQEDWLDVGRWEKVLRESWSRKKIKNKEDMKLKMQYAEEALEVEEL